MTSIPEIRRARLAEIVKRDKLSVAAARFQKPDSQIKDMIEGRKSFGEKVARAMEAAYAPDSAPGWLDVEISGRSDSYSPTSTTSSDSATPSDDEFALVQQLDLSASCGNGRLFC